MTSPENPNPTGSKTNPGWLDRVVRAAKARLFASEGRDGAAAARANLIEAIECMPDAFVLFDADDRLALCNRRYAETFTDCAHAEDLEGLPFEALVRCSIAKGEVVPPAFDNDVEKWVAERVRRHRHPSAEPTELELAGGRWLQVSERRTSSGGTVGVRRDITERKQSDRRQAMEHAVTRLLAQAESEAEAMPAVLETMCTSLEWDCGAWWRWDAQEHLLRCTGTWGVDTKGVRAFLAGRAERTFVPATGAGLLREVWKTGAPAWIADVATEPAYWRGPTAATAAVRGALAFPIRVGGEPTSVVELYHRNVRPRDEALLRVVDSIGLQIGQFIARKSAQAQLQQLAHFDYLTGLPNRNLFSQLLAHAVAKAARNSTRLALLFVDLDGFKQVNDRFGHDAGDHLLATFAERMGICLRRSDVVARLGTANTAARLGGDEFVVLVEDVEQLSGIEIIARRILAAAGKPFDLAGAHGHVGASVGISVFPEDGEDPESLLTKADNAMYAAKEAGRNTFRFSSAVVARQAAASAAESAAETA